MSVGKRSSSEITIAFDDGPNGTPRTITNFVLDMGGCKISSNMQASTAVGQLIESMHPTGTSKLEKFKLRGFLDTTLLTGPYAVLKTPDTDPNGGTRTLNIQFGDSKQWLTEGFLESFEVLGKAGNLTEFEAIVQQNSGGWQ